MRNIRSRVRRTTRGAPLAAIVILAALILGAVFAPVVAPYPPTETDLSQARVPPFYQAGGSFDHILGTDKVGRDIFSRILYGGQVSLLMATVVIILGGVAGTLLGLLSGYAGGKTDAAVQRTIEATLSLPTIMIALVFVFVVGQSVTSVVLILSPFVAATFARMVRGEVLRIRSSNYVALANVAGASGPWIARKHILPNVMGTVLVLGSLQVGALILVEASLSFLGLGVPPPTPAWGLMVADGREVLASAYWLTLFPGLAIVLTVLSINAIGDWLGDLLDPSRRAHI